MSIESNARESIAKEVREAREKKGWTREKLAIETGLKRKVIINLEHGVVNPSRHEFLRVVKKLPLTPEEKEKVGQLLQVIFPRQRFKFHLPPSVLRHRNRNWR